MKSERDQSTSVSRGSFDSARRRAFMQDILADLAGRSDDLLSFGDVRQHLRLEEPSGRASLQEIPLAKIVGSVGRYRDFNRTFLPRSHVDPERWSRINQLRATASLPPINVFKVGDVYFVRDGNHRVSVARSRGEQSITANVVEIAARVPLGPETEARDLILKSGYADFLEVTSLDRTCPGQRIELTRPGGYRSLLQHIEVHQFYMGLRSRKYPTLSDAAAHWYGNVYRPVVERILHSDILDHFPGRTEADLYLWIAENRARLQMEYGTGANSGSQTDIQRSDAIDSAVESFALAHRVAAPARWIRRALSRVFPFFRLPERDCSKNGANRKGTDLS